MIQTEALRGFFEARTRLIERLDASRRQIDALLEQKDGDGFNLSRIATIAGEVEISRDLLEQLVSLDDDFLRYLQESSTNASEDA